MQSNTIITSEQFEYIYAHFKLQIFKKIQSLIQIGDVVDCEFCHPRLFENLSQMTIKNCLIFNSRCRIGGHLITLHVI